PSPTGWPESGADVPMPDCSCAQATVLQPSIPASSAAKRTCLPSRRCVASQRNCLVNIRNPAGEGAEVRSVLTVSYRSCIRIQVLDKLSLLAFTLVAHQQPR